MAARRVRTCEERAKRPIDDREIAQLIVGAEYADREAGQYPEVHRSDFGADPRDVSSICARYAFNEAGCYCEALRADGGVDPRVGRLIYAAQVVREMSYCCEVHRGDEDAGSLEQSLIYAKHAVREVCGRREVHRIDGGEDHPGWTLDQRSGCVVSSIRDARVVGFIGRRIQA